MRIKLKRDWFYPAVEKPFNDARAISGGRLRKGIHEIDNRLREFLPHDAEILDEKNSDEPMVVVDTENTMASFDTARVGDEKLNEIMDEHNRQAAISEEKRQGAIKLRRTEALAKARAAKKAKAEAKKAD